MDFLIEWIGIPRSYLRPTLLDDAYIAATSRKWFKELQVHNQLPAIFQKHHTHSPEDVQALLWDSEALLGPDWAFIYVQVLVKPDGQAVLPAPPSDPGLETGDLSYSQFLHYVAQTNYKNLWKEAQRKFPQAYRSQAKVRQRPKTEEATEVLRQLLGRIYDKPKSSESSSHVDAALRSHAIESGVVLEHASHFVVFLERMPMTSMHQCLNLSPGLLNQNDSAARLYFLHQLLGAVKELQERSLIVEGLTWHRVFVSDTLSLRVLPDVAASLVPSKAAVLDVAGQANLQQLTTSWVRGCTSNFDYLMALNDLAGRQMDNPFHHPVLPWVSDLSSPFGQWRDLTKSKFRLNKGDRQLDLTFDASAFEAVEAAKTEPHLPHQVAHHVTDVLSEITFYVYQARRTARSVLCRYVRSHWNPLEYPSSVERVQQWTPDECIPQFFSDPAIFKSIHDDLPDLGYPSWANSAEDFIAKHRNALESPYVSERLHHWIDLTFGFRLSGSAAVKSRNVHLSLVDQHTQLRRRGVVQLFGQAHPRRLLASPYAGRSPPRLPAVGSRPAAGEQLSLPLDFNPTGLVQQLETVSQFQTPAAAAAAAEASADGHQGEGKSSTSRRQRDVQWLASLALELFVPQAFRLLRADAPLEQRAAVCRHALRHLLVAGGDVPRCLRPFLRAVFDQHESGSVVTSRGLPPPSAHQLLQPMAGLIAFPADLSAVASVARHLEQLLEQTTRCDFDSVGKRLSDLTAASSVRLLVPLVRALFHKSTTAFQTAVHLFDPMAAALGPQEAASEFVPALLKLMGPEEPSAPLVLLYHKRFLLMLQVRLGMRCFLQHFSLLLVEAVGGCYDLDTPTAAPPLQLIGISSAKVSKEPSAPTDAEPDAASDCDACVFTFDVGEEAAAAAAAATAAGADDAALVNETPSRNSSKMSVMGALYPVPDIHQLGGCSVSQIAAESLLWLATDRLGPVLTARYLTRNLLRMLALCYVDVDSLSRVETNGKEGLHASMFQMTGTLIRGDFNAAPLLTCLSSIAGLYGEQLVLLQYWPHAVEVVGRVCARTPASSTPASSVGSPLSALLEGGLIGVCSLVLAALPYLPDASLMLCLRETLLRRLLQPIADVVTSASQAFGRGAAARSALAAKLVDCLCAVAVRLGSDVGVHFVADPVVRLLATFERVADGAPQQQPPLPIKQGRPDWMGHQRRLSSTLRQVDENSSTDTSPGSGPPATEDQAQAEMVQTFGDRFAFDALSALTAVLGATQVQDLVERAGRAVRRRAARWSASLVAAGGGGGSDDADGGVGGERRLSRVHRAVSVDVAVVGNRIQLFDEVGTEPTVGSFTELNEIRRISQVKPVPEAGGVDAGARPSVEEAQDLLCYRRCDDRRHLRGNWLAYWEHEAGRHQRDTRFDFKQIRLLQLTGHTAGVRSIHVMDNELGVITAGRDKTARVWSLHSQGDGSASVASRFVYPHHRKPLLAVSFVEGSRLAASCDGAVHLWDPFVGTSVRQLDGAPTVTAVRALPPPSASLVCATAEGTLRLLDTRSPLAYQHEFKISPVAAGLVRCLAAGSDGRWVVAGHSSGMLSLVDLRTGMLLSAWKGHEGEVLQVGAWTSPQGAHQVISSSLDQSVSVWSTPTLTGGVGGEATEARLKCNLRGCSEPVHCLAVGAAGQLVTATTANRVGVYEAPTPAARLAATKLRSDTFRGVVTALALAPLNRVVLLGSDSGVVSAFC